MSVELIDIFYLAIGAFSGSLLRYLFSKHYGVVAILIINIVATMLLTKFKRINLTNTSKLLLITGFCGSLSTFSSYIHDMLEFFEKRQFYYLILYFVASNLISFVGAIIVYNCL